MNAVGISLPLLSGPTNGIPESKKKVCHSLRKTLADDSLAICELENGTKSDHLTHNLARTNILMRGALVLARKIETHGTRATERGERKMLKRD